MGYISEIRKYVGHQPILTAGVGLFGNILEEALKEFISVERKLNERKI